MAGAASAAGNSKTSKSGTSPASTRWISGISSDSFCVDPWVADLAWTSAEVRLENERAKKSGAQRVPEPA